MSSFCCLNLLGYYNSVHSGLGGQSVNVLSSVFQLDVNTDKPTYTTEENVLISSQISNLSQYAQVVDIKTTVQDSNGHLVEDLGTVQNIALGAGQTWQHPSLNFATGTTYEGLYQVQAQLLGQNGSEIALALASFVITTPSDTKVSGTISTDKAEYLAFDTVNVLSRIQNITPNALLEGYTATTTLYNPNNESFWTETTALPQLLPNSIKDLNASITLNAALAGNYRAELIIKDQNGIERSLSVAQFTVQSSAVTGSGISGSINVTPNPVLKTELLTLNASVNNKGNSELTNLPITITIVDPVTEAIIAEWTQTESTLAIQQTLAIQKEWQAQGTVGSTYIAVLSAKVNGQIKYLGRAPFVMAEKIVNHLSKADAGRILILLDPPINTDNVQSTPNAFEDNAELARQRLYLENLLNDNGWSYTIVTDKDDFATELRSHAYTQYGLFSAKEKLDEQVQKELREAVFKGEGLLQAGDHDQRYNQLDEALGTLIKGKHNSVTGLDVIESPWPLTGQTDWYPSDKPLLAELKEKAQAVAYYLGLTSSKSSALAIARNQYGKGHTVFMGFDILAHGSIEGADPLNSALLLEALTDTIPDVNAELTVGDPVAIQIALTNKGTDALLQTIVTLPEGSKILDDDGAQLNSDGTLSWEVELKQQQSATLNLWIRLPEDTQGDVTINADILISLAGQWENYDNQQLVISLTPEMNFEQVLTELQLLTPAQNYKPVLQAIEKALLAKEQMQYDKALQFLIQASDSLIRLKTEDADKLRQKLVLLITAIARKV